MEKTMQAIDIAAVTAGKRGTTQGNTAGNEESTSFSKIFAPVEAQAARPQAGETADESGKLLPEEQALPEEPAAVQAEPQLLADLLELADADEIVMADNEVVITDDEMVNTGDEVVPAILPTDTPLAEMVSTPVTPVDQVALPAAAVKPDSGAVVNRVVDNVIEQPRVETMVKTAVSVTREVVLTGQQAEPAPVHGAQSPVNNASSTADAALAAVRAGVQQALSAQVSQEGLRQSLGGNRQEHLLTARAISVPGAESAVQSFNPLLTETAALSSTARIAVPVGEAGWARAVGEQVAWHVSQNIQSASLRLNPQHLGPMEMQVQMDGDKATLAFTSHHALVRDALESALPRLREMFAAGGLEIVDVNVSDKNTSERDEQQANGTGKQSESEDEAGINGERLPGALAGLQEGVGLVDYYI
jgi:flagellar hook-length control protein FliK